ncbi:MAG: PIN domain-containing protein [Lachnospiraceae bacterium]|nr:PIN domain-containing protein [Lachnospiraceae bacterium]
MKILIDTNIVLDVMLKREPFHKLSLEILGLAKRDDVEEYVSASAITDIYYLAYRQLRDKGMVKNLMKELLTVVYVASVSEKEIQNAINIEWADFEDSVQYSVAVLQAMDGVVTRNPNDYKAAEIKVWKPEELLTSMR